jgi:hypothetical protein
MLHKLRLNSGYRQLRHMTHTCPKFDLRSASELALKFLTARSPRKLSPLGARAAILDVTLKSRQLTVDECHFYLTTRYELSSSNHST